MPSPAQAPRGEARTDVQRRRYARQRGRRPDSSWATAGPAGDRPLSPRRTGGYRLRRTGRQGQGRDRSPGAERRAAGRPRAGSQDPAATAPAETPAADSGTTAPAPDPAAAASSSGGSKPAASGAASAAPKASQGSNTPATRSAAGNAPAGGSSGGSSSSPKGGAPSVPAPGVPAPGGGGGGAAPTGPATGTPLSIGTICECSGPAGASVGPGIASNQFVVKWINDNGGLNGHPIKLFVGDSNSDPNRHFALVKQMVEENKVIAFMGMMAPLTINASDKYLRDKGIPVIGGDGAHGLWFGSPMLFFPGPSYTTQAVGTAKLALALKTPKVAMFYCAEAQPCQLGRDALHSKLAAEKAPGFEIVYEAKVSLAQPDFSAECLQAKGKGAQAVIVFVDAAAASRTTRSCIQQGYKPQWLTSPLTSAKADDPNNEGMTNPTAVAPWFAEETPAQKKFHDAVRRYNPQPDGERHDGRRLGRRSDDAVRQQEPAGEPHLGRPVEGHVHHQEHDLRRAAA